MSRHILAITGMFVVVGLVAGVAMTQGDEGPAGPHVRPMRGEGPRGHGPRGDGKRAERMFEKLAERLDLTDEEVADLKEAWAEHREAVAEHREENREAARALHEKMRAARADGDEEELAELREELREMMKGRAKLRADLHERIMDALPEDKAEKLSELHESRKRARAGAGGMGARRGHVPPLAALHRLELTEDQKDEIKAIVEEAHEKIQAVLTDEQRERLQQMRKKARGRRGEGDRRGRFRGRRGRPGGRPMPDLDE